MEIKSLSITNLPSYEVVLLKPDSFILCKMIVDCKNSGDSFKAGFVYRLPLARVQEIQQAGNCYFVEKVGGFE